MTASNRTGDPGTIAVPGDLVDILRDTARREYELTCAHATGPDTPTLHESTATMRRVLEAIDALDHPDAMPAETVAWLAAETIDWEAGMEHPGWPITPDEAAEHEGKIAQLRRLMELRDQVPA